VDDGCEAVLDISLVPQGGISLHQDEQPRKQLDPISHLRYPLSIPAQLTESQLVLIFSLRL
jgi:hypothetical protein